MNAFRKAVIGSICGMMLFAGTGVSAVRMTGGYGKTLHGEPMYNDAEYAKQFVD